MLACSFVLALALGPEPAASEPPPASALPDWRSAPEWSEPPEEPPKKPPKVPADGSGMITLGGLLLGTGATLGLTSIGLTVANNPSQRSARELAAIAAGFGLGSGAVFMSLGLVVRRQFRAREAASIPDAPRTGGGMLLGGLGMMLGSTAFAAQALVDMTTVTCGDEGCIATRPIGAPIQLGCAFAGMAVGTGLLVGGVRRRVGYQHWAAARAELAPSFGVSRSSVAFGLAGRF